MNFFFLFLFLMALKTFAAPPLDSTDTQQGVRLPKKTLNENDLVYTSENTGQSVVGEKRSRIVVPFVDARSLPGRKGKVLFRLLKNDKVGLLQFSKDKTWQAVYSFKMTRKGWIPVSALEPPEKPALKIPPSTPNTTSETPVVQPEKQ